MTSIRNVSVLVLVVASTLIALVPTPAKAIAGAAYEDDFVNWTCSLRSQIYTQCALVSGGAVGATGLQLTGLGSNYDNTLHWLGGISDGGVNVTYYPQTGSVLNIYLRDSAPLHAIHIVAGPQGRVSFSDGLHGALTDSVSYPLPLNTAYDLEITHSATAVSVRINGATFAGTYSDAKSANDLKIIFAGSSTVSEFGGTMGVANSHFRWAQTGSGNIGNSAGSGLVVQPSYSVQVLAPAYPTGDGTYRFGLADPQGVATIVFHLANGGARSFAYTVDAGGANICETSSNECSTPVADAQSGVTFAASGTGAYTAWANGFQKTWAFQDGSTISGVEVQLSSGPRWAMTTFAFSGA